MKKQVRFLNELADLMDKLEIESIDAAYGYHGFLALIIERKQYLLDECYVSTMFHFGVDISDDKYYFERLHRLAQAFVLKTKESMIKNGVTNICFSTFVGKVILELKSGEEVIIKDYNENVDFMTLTSGDIRVRVNKILEDETSSSNG